MECHHLSLSMLCSKNLGGLIGVLVALLTAFAAAAQPAPGAAPSERTFSVVVTGEGPDVVLVPGLAGGGAVWDNTVARLQDEYTLHVVTLAGFAGEAPVAASTQDGFIDVVRDDLAAYVRALDAPAAIVGHSLGGFTALRVGLVAPEAVSRVVVVDALPFLASMQDPSATEETAAASGAGIKQMMALSSPEQFRAQQQMGLQSMMMSADSAAAYVDVHAASDPATVAQAFYDMWTTDLRDDLAQMTVPTLVLAAGAGFGMTPEATQEMYRAAYAGLEGVEVVAVPEARHFIQIDQPDAVAAHLRRFVSTDASSSLEPSRLFYGTAESDLAIMRGGVRQPAGIATETLVREGDALRWVLVQETAMGSMADTLWLHASTLAPLRYRSAAPSRQQTVAYDVDGSHLTGLLVRGDTEALIDATLAPGTLDSSVSGSLVPALSLRDGFETTLSVFHYEAGLGEREVRVVARETIGTIEGEREAWVVEERLTTPDGRVLSPRTWVDIETGVRWKTLVEVAPGTNFESVVTSLMPAR